MDNLKFRKSLINDQSIFIEAKIGEIGKGSMLGYLQFIFYPRHFGLDQDIALLQENGLGDEIGCYLLKTALKASCLKDRMVQWLIVQGSLSNYPLTTDQGYFLYDFDQINKKVEKFIKQVTFLWNPFGFGEMKLAKLKIDQDKESGLELKLERLAQYLEEVIPPYKSEFLRMYTLYSSRKEISEEEIVEKQQLWSDEQEKQELSEINSSNIIQTTASNWRYQLISHLFDHCIKRIRGVESVVSLASTYELIKLYCLIKEKAVKFEKSKEPFTKNHVSLLKEGQELLFQILSAKERVSTVNKFIENVVAPKKKHYVEHHQKCMDRLVQATFGQYIKEYRGFSKKTLIYFKKMGQEMDNISISGLLIEEVKKTVFKRLKELIEYRLHGKNVPVCFTNFVTAWSNQGSLRGQLDILGECVYLTGENKGQKVSSQHVFSSKN